MLTVSAKQQGNKIIALENGTEWQLRRKVKVKNRPFRDWNGDVLTFNSIEHCSGWCSTRNSLNTLTFVPNSNIV